MMTVDYTFDLLLNLLTVRPNPGVERWMKHPPPPNATNKERVDAYMRELGAIRVLKNELVRRQPQIASTP